MFGFKKSLTKAWGETYRAYGGALVDALGDTADLVNLLPNSILQMAGSKYRVPTGTLQSLVEQPTTGEGQLARFLGAMAIPLAGAKAKAAGKGFGFGKSIVLKAPEARGPKTALDMSQAARMERAKAMGMRTNMPLYHGTASDFDAFSLQAGGSTTGASTALDGVWTSLGPRDAAEFAEASARTETNAGPNILSLYHRADRPVRLDLTGSASRMEVRGAIQDAWDQGYDSIVVRAPGATDDWIVVRNPNQLRSAFAAFDPAKKDSPNLLAGLAGLAVVPAVATGAGRRGRAEDEAR